MTTTTEVTITWKFVDGKMVVDTLEVAARSSETPSQMVEDMGVALAPVFGLKALKSATFGGGSFGASMRWSS